MPVKLDPIDDQIVSVLARDGRATFATIGAEVGLSPHAAAERVRKLRTTGVIVGFSVILDEAQAGRSLQAHVDVRLAPSVTPEGFEQRALAHREVRSVEFVTGRYDFVVRVSCTDAEALDTVVRCLRREGAVATETRIVMRSRAAGRQAVARA